MDIELKSNLQKMAENKDMFKDVFAWDNGAIKYIAAIVYFGRNMEPDIDRIYEMKKLIADNTKRFSAFRNSFQPLLAILLSLEDNPKDLLLDMNDIAQMFKKEKIVNSAYIAAACYYIATNASKEDYSDIVKRFKQLYKGIRKEYPLITGVDDYLYFTMMAIKGCEPDVILERLKSVFSKLEVCNMKRNELQALALVILIMEGDDDILINKVISMHEELVSKGIELNSFGTSASIAILAEIHDNLCDISDIFINTVNYIKELDGFGDEYIDEVMRNIIAMAFWAYGSKRTDLVKIQMLCYMVLMISCSPTTITL